MTRYTLRSLPPSLPQPEGEPTRCPGALCLRRVWKGEEIRAGKEDQCLQEREISTHTWDGTGFTQACREPSDIQIQKDSWVVDPKLTGNIKCGYSSWVCAPQRVGGVSAPSACLSPSHFCSRGLGSERGLG